VAGVVHRDHRLEHVPELVRELEGADATDAVVPETVAVEIRVLGHLDDVVMADRGVPTG
jgi:hypothetical protein